MAALFFHAPPESVEPEARRAEPILHRARRVTREFLARLERVERVDAVTAFAAPSMKAQIDERQRKAEQPITACPSQVHVIPMRAPRRKITRDFLARLERVERQSPSVPREVPAERAGAAPTTSERLEPRCPHVPLSSEAPEAPEAPGAPQIIEELSDLLQAPAAPPARRPSILVVLQQAQWQREALLESMRTLAALMGRVETRYAVLLQRRWRQHATRQASATETASPPNTRRAVRAARRPQPKSRRAIQAVAAPQSVPWEAAAKLRAKLKREKTVPAKRESSDRSFLDLHGLVLGHTRTAQEARIHVAGVERL